MGSFFRVAFCSLSFLLIFVEAVPMDSVSSSAIRSVPPSSPLQVDEEGVGVVESGGGVIA
jgi:hypothetical protein